MAMGSVAWGWTAGAVGLDTAPLLAAAGAVAGIVFTWRFKLQGDAALDLSPSGHWSQPVVAEDVVTDKGPVLVTVEYEIDPADAAAFAAAVAEPGEECKRDGAFWQLFTDAADPRRRIATPVAGSRCSCSRAGSSTCASTIGSRPRTAVCRSACSPFTAEQHGPGSPT